MKIIELKVPRNENEPVTIKGYLHTIRPADYKNDVVIFVHKPISFDGVQYSNGWKVADPTTGMLLGFHVTMDTRKEAVEHANEVLARVGEVSYDEARSKAPMLNTL